MKKVLLVAWKWLRRLLLYSFLITNLWVILYRWINPPITFLQIREYFKSDREYLKDWVDYEDINPAVPLAVVSSEDQNFMKHWGLDLGAIEKAMKYNEGHKRKRGASTITQQTAKNVFLWPGRSFVRKGLEAYFSLLMECYWGKKRILEVYLNVIETGDNTFGIQAASKRYFRKDAIKLSKGESALFAASLPNPKKFNPGKPSQYMIKRRDQILQQMRYLGTDYFDRHGGL